MWLELIEAIRSNHTTKAIELVKAIDLNELNENKDQNGYTALHFAIFKNNKEVYDLILKISPQAINVITNSGHTVLHWAAQNGYEAACETILKISPEAVNASGCIRFTALHWAARNGHGSVCEIILKMEPQIVNAIDKYGWTGLHWAARNGHGSVCEVILKTDPRAIYNVDDSGHTALHLAAQHGHGPVCEAILSMNPRVVNAVDSAGQTALHFAAEKGLKLVCEMILRISPEAVKAVDKSGHTILHEAAIGGHKAICKILIPKMTLQAIHAIDNAGHTALDKALRNNHEAVCEILKINFQAINTTDNNVGIALYVVDSEGHKKAYKCKTFDNFTGRGLEGHSNESYWYEYSKEGISQLLTLRLENLYVKGVSRPILWNNSLQAEKELSGLIISDSEASTNKILVPINLYGKHWVGLVIDKTSSGINIHYMDSEQKPIPALLKNKLVATLSANNPAQQICLTETELEKQKYNNCGPEMIENFVEHLIGHRLSQENAVPIYSLLYEDSVTLTGDYDYQLE